MDILNELAITNDYKFNHLKAVEELSELIEVLMKKVLKDKEHQPSDQSIIDEIGDAQIRLDILQQMYGWDRCIERIKEKIHKFDGYLKEGKYKNNI